jgi:hypothetical protein
MQNLHHARVRPKRRTITSAVLVCLALSLSFIAIYSLDDEPRFEGKRLSHWLALYDKHAMTQTDPDFQRAEQAIRAMGTNALPHMLKWIDYEPPAWRRGVRKALPAKLAENETLQDMIEGEPNRRAAAAMLGFGILGTNAQSVIPELEVMMRDKSAPNRAGRAIFALSGLGIQALPSLTNALADPQQLYRNRLIFALGFNAPVSGTNAVLPALMRALNDDDQRVRSAATIVVRRIAPEVLTNAPPQ